MRRLALVLTLGACTVVPALAARWAPVGYAQTTTPPLQGDEFNATNFTAPFVVQCAPQATAPCPDPTGASTWSLDSAQPGYLRIQTLPGTLVGTDTNNARNLVLQPVANASADYTATTSLMFPGTGAPAATPLGQTAGIIVYQDADHFIYLGRSFTSANNGLPQLEFRQEDGAVDLVNTVSELTPVNGTVYLRLVKTGTLYQAFYSYDNVTFTQINAGAAPTPTATSTPATTSTPTVTPVPPTSTPTQTPVPATATATATATAVPPTSTPTATSAPTNTPTSTPGAAVAHVQQQVSGYTATYASPQVGLFAWGGTNAAASANVIPADFDWFRVGGNSQTPVPTTTATTTATATATSAATSTPAVTPSPPPPPPTSTPAPTSTPTVAPTATSVPPVPTATPKPKPRAPKFGFRYVSAWYHWVRIGDKQHLQAQAKIHSKQGIWVTITFASGKKIHIWTTTDNNGFWQTEVKIPYNTIGRHSHKAWVTFQLWKGNLTTKRYAPFNVARPR